MAEFKIFYQNLYSSAHPPETAIRTYLESIAFNVQLSEQHRDYLDSPITAEEVLATIRHLKAGKAPG